MRHNGQKMKPILILLIALIHLTACKVSEDYKRQEQNLPENYRQAESAESIESYVYWFELFDDPVLSDLIYIALDENKNLQIAVSRLKESYLYFDISKTDFYPNVNYYGGVSSGRNSATSKFSNSAVVGANVSYTVDLWQRIKTASEASMQEYLSTAEAHRAVTVNIISAVASAYISMRDLDNQMLISEKTAVNFKDNLDVMQSRFDAGFISEVDLAQSKIQLIDAYATIETLDRSRVQLENGINVLLGTTPKDIPRGLELSEQISSPNVPVGLPSQLIDRRPDVLEAEHKLNAQTLRIGVAEALRYPSLTLSFDMGAQLINPTFLFADLGAQIFGPLFNAGKLKKGVDVERVRAEQLLFAYQLTYITAIKEVEDALIAQRTYGREYELRLEQMELATKASHLARVRYDGGLTSYLEVIALQSSQFSAELRASAALRQELLSVIELYQALGGGWQPTIEE